MFVFVFGLRLLQTSDGIYCLLSYWPRVLFAEACLASFSLFRSPAKNVTGGQRVSCVLVEGGDKVLTLSDDGKVKRWNTRSSKCLAEKVVSVDRPGSSRKSALTAFKMCLMPRKRKLVFALRAEEDAPGENVLVQCNVDKLADLRPEDERLDSVMVVVKESLEKLG